MTTRLITPPAGEPIELAIAKLQCRVDGDDEDLLFTSIILPGTRQQCEQILRRSLMLQTWCATFDAFPREPITLAWPRLQSVTGVEYRDADDAWQTLSPSAYSVATAAEPGRVSVRVGTDWPTTSPEPESIRVTYTAGYAAGTVEQQRAAIPETVKSWMLLRIGTAYKFREELIAGASVAELPGAYADSLLDRERIWSY